jgi:hypothetical protein
MATAKTPIEATAVGANPFLAVIVIVALARSFNEARYREEYGSLAKGVMKGGVGTGAFLAASLVAGPTLPNWQATNAMANVVGQHWVTCTNRDVDRYGRVVAVCRAGPINLNAWMVGNGVREEIATEGIVRRKCVLPISGVRGILPK